MPRTKQTARKRKSTSSTDNTTVEQLPDDDSRVIGDDDLKEQLLCILEDVQTHSAGSFATSGLLPNPPNPGLSVDGFGTVGLPLSVHDAVELRKICHQAPFGKGGETIVDTDVRNTWELNPDNFQLRNPAWQACLETTVQQVAKALGIVDGSSSIRAELYKLLLYEEGAFFESHTDTEKAPGMFGTLVIALPSRHTGGEVHASFSGQEQVLETAEASEFGYSYLAWYSNVEHTVRPVSSGNRLVLTYNLLHIAAGTPQLASSLNENQAKLNELLELWNRGFKHCRDKSPKMLAYVLDHKYTEANLRLAHLKGSDRSIADHIYSACRDQDFCFFLANLEHTKYGPCEEAPYDPYDHYGGLGGDWGESEASASDEDPDQESSESGCGDYHALDEICDTSLRLRTLFKDNGEQLATNIFLDDDVIVQEDAFDRMPDKEDYSGYTGNEGVSATHFYRNSCILIMPRDYHIQFLLGAAKQGKVNLEAWVGRAIEDVRQKPEDSEAFAQLTRICEHIVSACQTAREAEKKSTDFYSWPKPSSFSDDALGLVAKAALQLESPPIFESAALAAKDMLPIESFQNFGRTLPQLGFDQWQHGLEIALNRIQTVHQRFEALDAILRAYQTAQSGLPSDTHVTDALETLMLQSLELILSSELVVSKADAHVLMELIFKYGEKFLFQRILPFLKNHVSSTAFSVSFLVLLFKSEQEGAVREGVARNIYRDVLSDLIPVFNPASATPAKRARHSYSNITRHTEAERKPTNLTDSQDIASLIDHCRTMSLYEEEGAILGKLMVISQTVDVSAFESLLLPLLITLAERLRGDNNALTSNTYRAFFQNIIDTYIRHYVDQEPARPRDWTQAPRGCGGCRDCPQLDAFLVNPTERVGRFCMAERRRTHFERRIADTGCTHVTERTGSPHTLVITKTEKLWRQSHQAWKERCKIARQKIQEIGAEALGDRYNEFVGLKAVKLSTGAVEEASAGTAGSVTNMAQDGAKQGHKTPLGTLNQATNKAPGQKSGSTSDAVIVDLTSE